MNLIEQLGGYEMAKQKAENALANQVTRISYKTKLYINGEETNVVTGAYVRDIKKALLEYRRQHNIFEVGDKVVRRNGIEYEIHKIELVDEYDLKIFSQNMSHSYWVPKGQLRHAEPEEIKAGKRLEVNDGST